MTYQTKIILQTFGKITIFFGSVFIVGFAAKCYMADEVKPKPKQEQEYEKPTEAINEMPRYRYKSGAIGTRKYHQQEGEGREIFKNQNYENSNNRID